MTGIVSGFMTLFLLILFLGIVFWAYSKRNKPVFDEMAALPLAENSGEIPPNSPVLKEGASQQNQSLTERHPPLVKEETKGFKAQKPENKEPPHE